MLTLGPERCRLSCTLRAMAAAETACPELWSSEEAQEDRTKTEPAEPNPSGAGRTWRRFLCFFVCEDNIFQECLN